MAVSIGVAALLVASGPVGWAIGLGVLGMGLYGTYCANGLNEGWTTDKWIGFSTSVGLDLVPFVGWEGGVAGKLAINYVEASGAKKMVTTVSGNYEGYVITNMPKWAGDTYVGGYISTMQYIKYGTTQSVLRTACGATGKDAVKEIFKDLATDQTKEAVIDEYSPEIDQYDSTIYGSLSDYLN